MNETTTNDVLQRQCAGEVADSFFHYLGEILLVAANDLNEATHEQAADARAVANLCQLLDTETLFASARCRRLPVIEIPNDTEGRREYVQQYTQNELRILRAKLIHAQYNGLRQDWLHEKPIDRAEFMRHFNDWINWTDDGAIAMINHGITADDVYNAIAE
jgi:hypothetical protein